MEPNGSAWSTWIAYVSVKSRARVSGRFNRPKDVSRHNPAQVEANCKLTLRIAPRASAPTVLQVQARTYFHFGSSTKGWCFDTTTLPSDANSTLTIPGFSRHADCSSLPK
jgi:hypothetical protein